mgnify:CR=1 FL=1
MYKKIKSQILQILISIYFDLRNECKNVVGQFKCDPCDKTFRRAGNLKSHELSKHQMRRFQCKQCDSNYSLASTLSRHVQSVHERKRVECNMCDYKALHKRSLKAHLQSKHEKLELQCEMYKCIPLIEAPYWMTKKLYKYIDMTTGNINHTLDS